MHSGMDMARTATATWIGVVLAAAAGGTSGCYDSVKAPPEVEPPDCEDQDGDGWGAGDGCVGFDCDDADPGVWNDCTDDCAASPLSPGCPCDAAFEQPQICYAGPAGTQGVGQCTGGLRICRNGAWTGCEGQILPADEGCDYADNDCDGIVDDGVTSACGDCNADCNVVCAGVGCDASLTPSSGAELQGDGAVVVGDADLQPHEIWIASSQGGTVVRVDTRSLSVLGSYRTGPGQGADVPQAVAMDGEGNAFVVNSRQGQGSSTLTKILAAGCPDLDGSGGIDTSTDDEPLRWGDDECVAWNAALEDCGNAWGCGYGWGIALAESGRTAWVSLYQGGRIVEVDTELGELTGREVSVNNATGLVADPDGAVWVAASDRSVRRFYVDAPEQVDSFALSGQSWFTNIDVGVDGRVYAASPLAVYDPVRDEDDTTGWYAFDVVTTEDGSVWGTDGQNLRRYDGDLADYDAFSVSGQPYQLAADRDGQVWGAGQWGNTVVVVDAATGEEVANDLDGCGAGCLNAAYLEGDPAGARFRRAFGGGLGEAAASFVLAACEPADGTSWGDVSWETSGGAVAVSVRTANSEVELSEAPWTAVGSAPPSAGSAPVPDELGGRFIEIRAVLRDHDARVDRLGVDWSCFGGGFE